MSIKTLSRIRLESREDRGSNLLQQPSNVKDRYSKAREVEVPLPFWGPLTMAFKNMKLRMGSTAAPIENSYPSINKDGGHAVADTRYYESLTYLVEKPGAADDDVDKMLARAIETLEHDLYLLQQHLLSQEQEEQRERKKEGKAALPRRQALTKKEMASLEEMLDELRKERAGGMQVRRERHGPRWCWHVILQAGTLVLGLESLICVSR